MKATTMPTMSGKGPGRQRPTEKRRCPTSRESVKGQRCQNQPPQKHRQMPRRLSQHQQTMQQQQQQLLRKKLSKQLYRKVALVIILANAFVPSSWEPCYQDLNLKPEPFTSSIGACLLEIGALHSVVV